VIAPIEIKTNMESTIISKVIIPNYALTQGPSLESIAIAYPEFHLIDFKLWDGITSMTLIFRVNTYIETNTQNIISSLSRISKFIKQYSLDDKTKINIHSITLFSSTV